MNIKVESCTIKNGFSIQPGISKKPLLSDVVDGVKTFFFEFQERASRKFITGKNGLSVFLFIKGNGSVILDDHEFTFDEVALFAPSINKEFMIISGTGDLGFLQLELELTSDDHIYLENKKHIYPLMITYSDCKRYREAIKSKKTINRTLLPEDIVPRLCIGSVETTGPDQVDKHSHPMLEQYFFGLEQNNCVVTADNDKTKFLEYDFLHIPTGSEHGINVDYDNKLHYIWIDIFHNLKDISYIKEHHFDIDDENQEH